MTSPTETDAWTALSEHHATIAPRHLRELFADDPSRAERMTHRLDDFLFDLSKNRATDETLTLLLDLAKARGLPEAIEAMFSAERINTTENRAVLHVALRAEGAIELDGHDVVADVKEVLGRIRTFTTALRDGSHKGHTGQTITDVVNIGIGGSDLGPLMVCAALAPYWRRPELTHPLRFSNVDGSAHRGDARSASIRRRTLFIVASKTFTTHRDA